MLDLLVWVAIVFVSVLVHEMGHILMGRYFGSRGHIILTGFCGLAVGSSELPERWQRNAVSLAGPGAGFLLAAVVAGVYGLVNPDVALALLGSLIHVQVSIGPDTVIPSELVWSTLYLTLWINIFWGLVNLLPIWPLDGGQISREICQAYRGRDGVRLSLLISLFTAAALAVLALIEFATKKPLVSFLSFGASLFPVLFFGLLAFSSWQFLQFQRRGGFDWEDQEDAPRAPWEQDADWWKKGDNPWRD
ncbi:MAG: site-2 protease family protein [Planctomycetes bacterium]|nr:site-2 protease family protein [Planctomycetota bacterium]